jgi:Acetyltransferase (GNAT) domain
MDAIRARSATDGEWDRAWRGSAAATYSMSRQWAQLWCEHSRGYLEPQPIALEFPDGLQVVLPLAAARRYKGAVRHHFMPAGGGYGGPLATQDLSDEHCRAVALYLRSLGNLDTLSNPIDPRLWSLVDAEARCLQDTQLLRLDSTMAQIFSRWSKGAKSSTRKADRSGVSVRRAVGQGDWRAYFDVYQDTLRRWGDRATSNYPWPVFDALSRADAAEVRLWLAEHGGRIISGAVCLHARCHVSYWHGATLEEYFGLCPANAVMHAAIEDAVDSSRMWFDFGLSGGHEGVASFKRGFGAEAVACSSFMLRRRSTRLIESLAKALG